MLARRQMRRTRAQVRARAAAEIDDPDFVSLRKGTGQSRKQSSVARTVVGRLAQGQPSGAEAAHDPTSRRTRATVAAVLPQHGSAGPQPRIPWRGPGAAAAA